VRSNDTGCNSRSFGRWLWSRRTHGSQAPKSRPPLRRRFWGHVLSRSQVESVGSGDDGHARSGVGFIIPIATRSTRTSIAKSASPTVRRGIMVRPKRGRHHPPVGYWLRYGCPSPKPDLLRIVDVRVAYSDREHARDPCRPRHSTLSSLRDSVKRTRCRVRSEAGDKHGLTRLDGIPLAEWFSAAILR
jgi:hypothetical protein